MVTINTDLPESQRCCFIGQNMRQAGRTAAQVTSMLLEDKKQIAIFTASNSSRFGQERVQGFEDYAQEKGSMCIAGVVETNEQPDIMYSEAKRFLKENPDIGAFYITCGCVSDAARAVAEEERDIRIICYDSFPENKSLMRQGMIDCIIDQELESQGEEAIQLLFQELIKGKQIRVTKQYMPIEIHIQENIDY
ncbi:MAG: substrate-binding domain-containing protein [Eubacteriales bacterium]|nr:substrate-binding domain-containing protein [Eubacteriales bacterium]